MKWFKHMVDAATNPTIVEVETRLGFAGLGHWWRILEVIAKKLDKKNRYPKINATLQDWRKLTRIHPTSFKKTLDVLAEKSLITLSIDGVEYEKGLSMVGVNYEVGAPKLLEILDNSASRYVVNTSQDSDSELELDLESDTSFKPSARGQEVGVESVPVTKQLFGTIQLADGQADIFRDQIDEWDRMFPNVCVPMEVEQTIRWAKSMASRNAWTPKQRKEWVRSQVALRIYNNLRYRQKENSGVHIQQAQEEKQYAKMPPLWGFMSRTEKEEYEAKHGKVR